MADFFARIKALLDTSDFENDLKKLEKGKKIKLSVESDASGVDNITKSIDNAEKKTKKFGNTLKDAFSFGGVAGIAHKAISAIGDAAKDAVADVRALDEAITDLRIATGKSYSYVSGLLKEYNKLAKDLGSTTIPVSESADTWLRQGYDIVETQKLITDSMMLSTLGQLDSANASKYLTSVLKGYKLETEQATSVVDKLSAVDLEAAVSAGGLAEALARSSNNANLMGVSMEKLLGYITVVGETTQKSMSTVGNSFQSIFSRMSKIKVGKLQYIDEDGTEESLSDVETVLNNLGIKLRESNNEFRNFGDVLDEVAAEWGNYSSVQQAAIAQAFAGTYQRENFIVLMENYAKAAEYTTVALNSAGTASQKFGAYLDGLEAKTNSLQTALESLAFNTISPESIGSITDAATAIVTLVDETNVLKGTMTGLAVGGVIKAFTAVKTGIASATIKLNQFNSSLKLVKSGNIGTEEIQRLAVMTDGLSQNQLKAVLSSKNLTIQQRIAILTAQGLTKAEAEAALSAMGLATAEGTATGATTSLSGALKGLWATIVANPIGLIVTAVTATVSVFTTLKQNAEQAHQATVSATRAAADSAKNLSEEVTKLTSKYIKLSEAVKTDESVKDDLTATQQDLIEKLKIEQDELDTLIKKYGDLDTAIKQASLSDLQTAEIDLRGGVNIEEAELLSSATPEWWNSDVSMQKFHILWTPDEKEVSKQALNALSNLGYLDKDSHYDDFGADLTMKNMDLSTAEGVIDAYKRLGDALKLVSDRVGSDNAVYKSLFTQYNAMTDAVTAYKDSITALNTNLAQQAVLNATIGKDLPKTQAEFDTFRQGIIDSVTATGTFAGATDDVVSAVNAVLASQSAFSGFYATITDAATGGTNTIISESQKLVNTYRGMLTSFSDAIDEFSVNGTVSLSTYEKVISYGEDYADLFVFTAEGIEVEEDAIDDLIPKLMEEAGVKLIAVDATEEQIQQTMTAIQSLKSYANTSDSAMDAIKDFIDIQKDMEEGTEYSTLQMLELVEKYPELAVHIQKTANGYIIEANAIKALIGEKSKLLSINDSLMRQSTKSYLSSHGMTKTASVTDEILSEYYRTTGTAVKNWEEFLTAREQIKGWSADVEFNEGYKEDVLAAIADFNAALLVEDAYKDFLNGTYLSGTSGDDAETEFEKQYKLHQHLVAIGKETDQEYLNWLKGAYENAYQTGQIELDEYRQCIEEVYNLEKDLLNDSLSDIEHNISLLEHQPDKTAEIVENYRQIQEKIHAEAEKLRAEGVPEDDARIQELQEKWWQYEEAAHSAIENAFNKFQDKEEYKLSLLSVDEGDSEEIISIYRDLQNRILEEIELHKREGLTENDDLIQKLREQWQEYENEITDTRTEAFENHISDAEYAIKLLRAGDGDKREIVRSYGQLLDDINAEIAYHIADGKDMSSEIVQDLMDKADSIRDELSSLVDDIVNDAEEAVAKFTDVISDNFSDISKRANAVGDAIAEVNKQVANLNSAASGYLAEMSAIPLSNDIKIQIENGTIDLSDYNEETQNQIRNYQELYEASKNALDSAEDLADEIANIYQENFNNLKEDFDNQLSILEHEGDMIDKELDLLEASGRTGSSAYYKQLISLENERASVLRNQLASLKNALREAVNSKEIDMYSDAWYDMKNSILDTEEAIKDAELSVKEFQNAIRDMEWENFDNGMKKFERLGNNIQYYIDLLSHGDLTNEDGSLTEGGRATVGLHGLNYDLLMQAAEEYAMESAKVAALLERDPMNQELIDRRAELIELQQEAILAAQDEKEAIKDLVQEGIDGQLNAMQELIDKYKDALDSAKDLYDYQNRVSDATKEIGKLQKQIIAYAEDDSEETKAQIQKLKVDLEEAQKELTETEYDQFIADQKKLLDELYTGYETVLNTRLDNIDNLILSSKNELSSIGSLLGGIYNSVNALINDPYGVIGTRTIPRYASGGLNKKTGLAWLDGTKMKPEAVLNAEDTENFLALRDALQAMAAKGVTLVDGGYPSVANVPPIVHSIGDNGKITEKTLSNITNTQIDTHSENNFETNISIDRVDDYNDFVTKLKNDKRFEKMVQAMTVDQIAGRSSLAKHKYNWSV